MDLTESLERLLAQGRDDAALRFGLGSAYLRDGAPARAAEHLAHAVALDPGYSAAWKAYGRALAESGRAGEAAEAYRAGIRAAEERGDVQSAKEMRVFLRRLERSGSVGPPA